MENNQKAYQIFSSFKSKYYDDNNEEGTSKEGLKILDIDEEMKIIIQRINKKSKKSTTTRIKALQRMHEILKEKHESYFDGLIKLFVIIYEKIITSENDISVLGELQKCLEVFILKGDKAIKKNFGLIFPYIYFSSFELNKDVANATRANLSRLLKEDSKTAKALFMFRDKYLALVHSIFDNPDQFVKDMSIYDEKEVNEIIFKKLMAMVWWSLARTLQLARNLPPEEQGQLTDSVFKASLQSPEPLILKMFAQYKNDYVVRISLLNFLNVLFTANYSASVDKVVIKKIVQAVAVANLDDPNLSFQTFLWKDAFAVRLLETARALKVDFGPIRKKFLNLVENHAFGAEQAYYQNLNAALDVLMMEESVKSGEAFFKEAILAHFGAVLKDDLRFEISAHYKTGFSLLGQQLQKFEKQREDEAREGDFAKAQKSGFNEMAMVKDVLSSLINLFFSKNNSAQKNLNVLLVNNIKHFPPYLCEFLEKCFSEKTPADFFEAIIQEYNLLITSIFKENLADRNKISNIAIFVKYFERFIAKEANSDLPASPEALGFYARIVHSSFQRLFEVYKAKCATLEDNGFAATAKELESLTAFVDEACEESFHLALEALFENAAGFKAKFEEFLAGLQADYLDLVLGDKVDDLLIDPANREGFSAWMGEFVKGLYLFMDYEPIVRAFADELLKGPGGKGRERLWQKALSFSVERPIAKRREAMAGVFDPVDPRNTSALFALKSSRSFPFMGKIQKLGVWGEFLRQLTFVFLRRDQPQFAVPLLVFCEADHGQSLGIVARLFVEHWREFEKEALEPIDVFKMRLNTLLLPILGNEDFGSTLETLQKLSQGLSPGQARQISSFLVEDILQLESTKILQAYELLLARAISLNEKALNPKLTIKQFSHKISQIASGDLNSGLEAIFAKTLLLVFGQPPASGKGQESAADVLRAAIKPLGALDWQRVFGRAFADPAAERARRLDMLVNVVCQPSAIRNYTSNRRRIFWSALVYGSVMSFIIDLHGRDLSEFEAVFAKIIAESLENVYLVVFVKRVLKQFTKDESFAQNQKRRILQQMMAHFALVCETAAKDADASKLQAIAFNYKELASEVSPSGVLDPGHWRDLQRKIEVDQLGIFALINQILNQKLGLDQFPDNSGTGISKEDTEREKGDSPDSLQSLVDRAREISEKASVRAIGLSLYLELVSLALERREEAVLAANSETLERFLVEILGLAETSFAAQFSQNCFYQFLVVIRKLINVLEMFSENFEADVLRKISKYTFFLSRRAKGGQAPQFWTIPPEEFFNEIAETIARFALREVADVSLEEVFQVLEIDINCLKKSAFYLLQQFKRPFEPDREAVEAVARGDLGCEALIGGFPPRLQVVLFDAAQTEVDAFTYFLYWSFALRLCGGQTEAARQKFVLFSTLFNDSPRLFQNLLTSLFVFFKNKRLNEREIFTLLDRTDFQVPENNWGDFISEETKEAFGVHLFFLFASLFPKNLRKWIEEEKKLANIATVFLNYKINQAIFAKEIEKIELSQHEWKAPDFEVFVYKNSREISAVYFKDDNRLEVTLRVPDNYPVKLIEVALSREAKITEAKANKWVLMIKRMLTNQNYSIIDALVTWKNNIEKEFEGIEDCAICYCIIHTTSKKLPTMPCKTCKKKFHSDCVHRWFQTSMKSECPLCKSQFL